MTGQGPDDPVPEEDPNPQACLPDKAEGVGHPPGRFIRSPYRRRLTLAATLTPVNLRQREKRQRTNQEREDHEERLKREWGTVPIPMGMKVAGKKRQLELGLSRGGTGSPRPKWQKS